MTVESYKEDKRPAQQWYWDDWFSAFDVRLCSLAARGLWTDMIGIMWKAEIRGTLTVNGKQPDNKTLAKIVGFPVSEIKPLLKELEMNNVFSRLDDGTIICRRMFRESVKKADISKIRSIAGSKGAKKRWQTDGKTWQKNFAIDKRKCQNDGKISPRNDGKGSEKKMAKMAASSPTPSSTSTSTSKPCPKKHSDTDIKLTELLISKILENNPKSRIQKMTEKTKDGWIDECRKLREIDKRTPEEIEAVIGWCQDDEFEKAVILSMPKLRKRFDNLWMKSQRGGKSARKEDPAKKAWIEKKDDEEEG